MTMMRLMPVPLPGGGGWTGWVGVAGAPVDDGAGDGAAGGAPPVAVRSGPVVPVMVRVLDGSPVAEGPPPQPAAAAVMTSPATTSSRLAVRRGVVAIAVGRCTGR